MELFGKEIKKKHIITSIVILIALVTGINSCSTVKQRERGVEYVFGKVKGDVVKPGLKFHAPFIANVQSIQSRQKLLKLLLQSEKTEQLPAICRQSERQ